MDRGPTRHRTRAGGPIPLVIRTPAKATMLSAAWARTGATTLPAHSRSHAKPAPADAAASVAAATRPMRVPRPTLARLRPSSDAETPDIRARPASATAAPRFAGRRARRRRRVTTTLYTPTQPIAATSAATA